MVVMVSSWWENFLVGLKVILCTNYVALVLKSSIEKRVGRTLSRVGKSGASSILLETRDVDPFHAIILAKLEPIHVGVAYHLDSHIIFVKELMFGCSERRDHNSQRFCWHSFLTPIHQYYIWW